MRDDKITKIDITIDANTYAEIINGVLRKAPLEIGVEIAVYMLLYGTINKEEYSVVDVNSMKKKQAKVLVKDDVEEISKVPDLVIVDKDFMYNAGVKNTNNSAGAYGIIEVKGLSVKYSKNEYDIQKENANNFIWTNGIKWYFDGEDKPSIDLSDGPDQDGKYKIKESEFEKLLVKLKNIKWGNN